MLVHTSILVAMAFAMLPGIADATIEACAVKAGCEEATLCENPDDTSLQGPSQVGARSIKINGLNVEAWYPSLAGSTTPAAAKNYDLRQWLPLTEQKKIPSDKIPAQVCDCFADLPIDTLHGPYPVILFAHGTAGFRTQTLSLMTHLASRGFVVLAADHPGLFLGDLLQFKIRSQVSKDLEGIVTALKNNNPALSFLQNKVQLNHIGMIGHSAGGNAISAAGAIEGVEFLVPMAAGGTKNRPYLRSSLVLGATTDKIVPFSRQQMGFEQSPASKRLLGLSNAGHLAFSDLCALRNIDGDDLVAVAQKYKIKNAGFASGLWDGCDKSQLDPMLARTIINYTVAAGAEETLQCTDRSEAFKNIMLRYPNVAEFSEVL